MTAHEPIHPGEILRDEFLRPLGINEQWLAEATGLPLPTVPSIVSGDEPITDRSATALAGALGTTSEFWLSLQQQYDRQVAEDR